MEVSKQKKRPFDSEGYRSIESHLQVIPAKAGIQELALSKQPTVYIMASKKNGTLYLGVTSDLAKRAWQHKNDLLEGFTKKYKVHMLVYYELHDTMEQAIHREKCIKRWKRAWKVRLIEEQNPQWSELFESVDESASDQ